MTATHKNEKKRVSPRLVWPLAAWRRALSVLQFSWQQQQCTDQQSNLLASCTLLCVFAAQAAAAVAATIMTIDSIQQLHGTSKADEKKTAAQNQKQCQPLTDQRSGLLTWCAAL